MPRATARPVYAANTPNTGSGTQQRPKVHWLRALRALRELARGDAYPPETIEEYRAALDGGDAQASYRAFLDEPGARELLAARPDLPSRLDDHAALAALPDASLGRAYLVLAERDGIEVRALADGMAAGSLAGPGPADPDQEWYHSRGIATHDLLHVLTEYGRDAAGETALLAFSLARWPSRILRVSLALALLGARPKRKYVALLRYVYRAYRRGRRACLPQTLRWEDLLGQPIDAVREQLRIEATDTAHSEGIWCTLGERGPWAPADA